MFFIYYVRIIPLNTPYRGVLCIHAFRLQGLQLSCLVSMKANNTLHCHFTAGQVNIMLLCFHGL